MTLRERRLQGKLSERYATVFIIDRAFFFVIRRFN